MQSTIEPVINFWVFFQIIFGGAFLMLIVWQLLNITNLQKAAKFSRIKAPFIWQVFSVFNLILLISSIIALFIIAGQS